MMAMYDMGHFAMIRVNDAFDPVWISLYPSDGSNESTYDDEVGNTGQLAESTGCLTLG